MSKNKGSYMDKNIIFKLYQVECALVSNHSQCINVTPSADGYLSQFFVTLMIFAQK